MTSPPDVQNVPDVWGLLEQASAAIYRLFHQTDGQRALISDINAALSQRDRFVLVPKEPVALRMRIDKPDSKWHYEDFRPIIMDEGYIEELLYAAAPKPEGKHE